MGSKKKPFLGSERRRYVRLEPKESIPIRFKIIESKKKKVAASDRAEPKSVSGGGMFLEIPILEPALLEGLLRGTHLLSLEMKVPPVSHTVRALARVIWVEGEKSNQPGRYGVGVSFTSISKDDREKILNYIIDRCLARS